MSVTKGKVVQMQYTLKNPEGVELDKSSPNSPFEYLHGAGQIVPGLEKAMEGLKVGDKKSVIVSSAEGYGEHNPQLKAKLKKSVFPKDMPLEPGIQFRASLEDGPVILRIESVEGDDVLVDGNHPLAGQTLHFEVEVVGFRDASPEEIAHGHAHGPNGHHH